MIHADPYEDFAAMVVLSRLDVWDQREAELIRGAGVSHLALFADWRAVEPHRLLSLVLRTSEGGVPFAVLGLSHTGQAGVAQAAMLSRDHRRFRRHIVQAARAIRAGMPDWCARQGVRRIEARAWAHHPTAGGFLTACGFRHEADMPGFGGTGATFAQYAWVAGTQE